MLRIKKVKTDINTIYDISHLSPCH